MGNSKKGRPELYPGAKQISILFPSEDFERMDAKVQREKRSNPNYAYSDLIRRYVRQGLTREARRSGVEVEEIDPKASPKRKAYAIGRLANRLAKELDG